MKKHIIIFAVMHKFSEEFIAFEKTAKKAFEVCNEQGQGSYVVMKISGKIQIWHNPELLKGQGEKK